MEATQVAKNYFRRAPVFQVDLVTNNPDIYLPISELDADNESNWFYYEKERLFGCKKHSCLSHANSMTTHYLFQHLKVDCFLTKSRVSDIFQAYITRSSSESKLRDWDNPDFELDEPLDPFVLYRGGIFCNVSGCKRVLTSLQSFTHHLKNLHNCQLSTKKAEALHDVYFHKGTGKHNIHVKSNPHNIVAISCKEYQEQPTKKKRKRNEDDEMESFTPSTNKRPKRREVATPPRDEDQNMDTSPSLLLSSISSKNYSQQSIAQSPESESFHSAESGLSNSPESKTTVPKTTIPKTTLSKTTTSSSTTSTRPQRTTSRAIMEQRSSRAQITSHSSSSSSSLTITDSSDQNEDNLPPYIDLPISSFHHEWLEQLMSYIKQVREEQIVIINTASERMTKSISLIILFYKVARERGFLGLANMLSSLVKDDQKRNTETLNFIQHCIYPIWNEKNTSIDQNNQMQGFYNFSAEPNQNQSDSDTSIQFLVDIISTYLFVLKTKDIYDCVPNMIAMRKEDLMEKLDKIASNTKQTKNLPATRSSTNSNSNYTSSDIKCTIIVTSSQTKDLPKSRLTINVGQSQ